MERATITPMETITTADCSSNYCNCFDLVERLVHNRFWSQFLPFLVTTCRAPDLEPPLTILVRAINGLGLHRCIRQPVWRRGRWKAL